MILIDAGHGGGDVGSSGNGIFEKDYTLLISKYMKERFDELGIPSYLIREVDETLTPSKRVERILSYGNTPDILVISNHLNAGGGSGAEVIYALRNNDTLAKSILEGISKTDMPVRKIYQRRLPSDSAKDYYFIHRNTKNTEPLIVEYGFIDNKDDAKRIIDNYKWYAEEVVKAVANYKGYKYKEPSKKEAYIVQKGDTLWNISKKLGISVDEIKKINNLNTNMLYIGQVLKVPTYDLADDSNITYIVKKGDTLYSISKEFNIPIEELKKYNNLTNDTLSINQIIKIPETSSIITPSEDEVINEGSVYVVEKGDTLYSIAKKFNTTVDKLKMVNSIASDILTIGMNLLIPGTILSDIIIHTVKKGDSLWSLANKYNTTVDVIKRLNNLVSDLLVEGQDLQVKRNTK